MNEFESHWISLSQSQSGVRVFWVNLREENKVSESNMAEFKMTAIIKFSQNEWVKFSSSNNNRIQDGCHHQVESEWMSEGFFVQMVGTNLGKCEWLWEEKLRWLNPRWPKSRWQNSRWLPSLSWVRMNEFESDWISLSQESEWRESVFEWIWEKITRCLNPRWQCLNPTW